MMPANHPFTDPDPERAQAARDAAKPMGPRKGEIPLFRDGAPNERPLTEREAQRSAERGGLWWDDGRYSPYDIIAAVDASGRVIRTAEGDVPVADAPQAGDDMVPVRRSDLKAWADAFSDYVEWHTEGDTEMAQPERRTIAAMRRTAGGAE